MEIRCMIIIFLTLGCSEAYRHFANKIPNGESVPHPCKPNYIWQGVGHENKNGGGKRNPFGADFYNAGKAWTSSLCNKDSDGDGLTNGEELGDPNCVWSEGNVPENLTGLSHPGVCQPMDSQKCQGKNDWVNCSIDEFTCEAIQNDTESRNLTVIFPRTQVAVQETTYICMAFDFVQDGDYHMIATEPLIDNINVMHHIALYGCITRPSASAYTPDYCGMGLDNCPDIIGLWTVGSTGECFHDHIGFRIGQNGYKYGVLQFHWNNPELRSDYTDGSGMVIHYTPNKRLHDAGLMGTGNMYIEIPPQMDRVVVESYYENFKIENGPIYLSRAHNHMHYLGREMKIEQFRNGVKLRDITFEDTYSYDSPKFFRYTNAIEFRAGDTMKTTCVYRSKSRTKTTFYGDGTNDEMCIGFMIYHPKQNLKYSRCLTWKKLDLESVYSLPEINGCRHWDFLSSSTEIVKALKSGVIENCQPLICLTECLVVVQDIMQHPCMVGDIGDWIKEQVMGGRDSRINYTEMKAFYSSISSCQTKMERGKCLSGSSSDSTSITFCTNLEIALILLSSYIYALLIRTW